MTLSRRNLGVGLLLGTLLLCSSRPTAGQEEKPRPFNPTKLEGKTIRPANPNDVLLLGVASRMPCTRPGRGAD